MKVLLRGYSRVKNINYFYRFFTELVLSRCIPSIYGNFGIKNLMLCLQNSPEKSKIKHPLLERYQLLYA